MTMTQGKHLVVPVIERDHHQGPATAAVTLVQYGDYECPYTRQATTIVRTIQPQLGDQLRFVFRNFPLTEIHPHALHAAFAAEAAAAQGKFWQMHDYIFHHQHTLEDSDLEQFAGRLAWICSSSHVTWQNVRPLAVSRRIFRAAYAVGCVERRRSLSTASSIQGPGSRKHCCLHSKK